MMKRQGIRKNLHEVDDVVAAADVFELVDEDHAELRVGQLVNRGRRQQDHRPSPADDHGDGRAR